MGRAADQASLEGCVSTAHAARVIGMKAATLRYWITQGLFKVRRSGMGTGNFSLMTLQDVAAAHAVNELRSQGVSLQACRLVQEAIAGMGESFSSARLLGYRDATGQTDVLVARTHAEGRRNLESIMALPGQFVMSEVALIDVSKELRKKFNAVLALPPLKRGRKPGQRNKAKTGETKVVLPEGKRAAM